MRKLAFHADNLRGFVTRSFPKNVREGGTPDEAVRIFAWEAIEREKLLFLLAWIARFFSTCCCWL